MPVVAIAKYGQKITGVTNSVTLALYPCINFRTDFYSDALWRLYNISYTINMKTKVKHINWIKQGSGRIYLCTSSIHI